MSAQKPSAEEACCITGKEVCCITGKGVRCVTGRENCCMTGMEKGWGLRGLELLHRIVWGPWLMAFFLAAGLWYTFHSGGFQFWGVKIWWKATAGSFFGRGGKKRKGGKENADKEISRREQLKTACTALAATVGTGNIVGVATAILAGGPGALFWMWTSAAIGMMTAYAEVFLGIKSREKRKGGGWLCGPFVYLETMAGKPGLAAAYALLCLLGSLGMGSMVQANSLAETTAFTFRCPPVWTAAVLVLITAMIIQGGQRRIGEAAAGLVPFSAGVYLLFSGIVLFLCRSCLGEVLGDIFREAFAFRAGAGAAAGWGMGNAVRYGIARGVFSNEAGLGTMAVLHGDSPGEDAALQGMWAMFEVFFDTIIVCTITGLVILCGMKTAGAGMGGSGSFSLSGFPTVSGAGAASWCFEYYLGKTGGIMVSVSLILFAFATIIGWYYLGVQALGYLLEKRREEGEESIGESRKREQKSNKITGLYQFLYLGAAAAGCLAPMGGVWLFSDIINGLLALPNLIALFLLWDRVSFPGSIDRKIGG